MKKILFVLLLMFSSGIMAQSIKSIENDPFEGTKVITTDKERLSKESFKDVRGQSMFYLQNSGKVVLLHLLWQCRDIIIVSKGQKAIFLADDDSKVTLEAMADVKPIAGIASTAAVKPAGLLGLDIPYSGMDIFQLVGKKIKAIRIYTSDGYQDFSVDKKKQSMISDCFKLLVEEM
jgi:hypothetical protein